MSYMFHDDLMYDAVSESRPCSSCKGDFRKCDGRCNGYASYGLVRVPDAEYRRRCAERERKREDAVLAEADAIRARRSAA